MKKVLFMMGVIVLFAGLLHAAGRVETLEEERLLIAFSQATMDHPYRVTMSHDMELWANRKGVDFVWLDGNDDPVTQLDGIRDLISQEPDLLFVSPSRAEPLTPIVQWCKEAGIPLICIDRGLAVEPDGETYKSFIIADLAYQHYENTNIMAEALEKKYGAPEGRILNLMGTIGSSAANDQQRGLEEALKKYPDIEIVASQSGDYSRDVSLRVVENWLTMYPRGTIDGIICANDESALGALQAIKEAGRDELLGYVTGVNGQVDALKAMLDGEMLSSNMNGPYWGEIAFTTAIDYLVHGIEPEKYIMILMPNYRADDPKELQRVKEAYDYCVHNNVQYPPISVWVESGTRLGLPITNEIPRTFSEFYGF